jgi:murein L,D-transpeptidase YcbB/YkuD
MEKPFELGHLVLKDNAIAIDTLEEKGCLLNQSPVVVPAQEKIPVLVWYNPAGINAEGKLVFYEDVYEKFLQKK